MTDDGCDLSDYLTYDEQQLTLPTGTPPVTVTHNESYPFDDWESPTTVLLNAFITSPSSLIASLSDSLESPTHLWLLTNTEEWPKLDAALKEHDWSLRNCYHLHFNTPTVADDSPIPVSGLCIHYRFPADTDVGDTLDYDADETTAFEVNNPYPSLTSSLYRKLITKTTERNDVVWVPLVDDPLPVTTTKKLGRRCYVLTSDSACYREIQDAVDSIPFGGRRRNTQSSFGEFSHSSSE